MTVQTIFWIILGASIIHVLEEYFKGWVKWVNQSDLLLHGITLGQFYAVNAIFIVLCLFAAVLNVQALIFSLSISALLFVNAIIHIAGTVKFGRYTPGLASAILLYVPLSTYTYYLYLEAGLLTLTYFILSFVLGAGWMILAVSYGLTGSRRK